MTAEELPLAGYDSLPLTTLQHRVRSLDAAALSRLAEYERAHANRAPVLTILDARMTQLRDGATPSSGTQETPPEVAAGPGGGSKVEPETSAEPTTPLRHGVASQTPGRARP